MLNQYVADLQKNPGDYALREKIIKHTQAMKQKPAIPEEARRHYVIAKTLSDEAKKVEDFNEAIAEFRGALLVAPWWAEANRDFGLTLEAAQRYDEAIAYIKLYMATQPGSERTRAAQDEIYKIEAKKKLSGKAAKETSTAAVSAPKQNTFEDLLKKINGRRYYYPIPGQNGYAKTLDVSGQYLLLGLIVPPGHKHRNDPGGFISYANRPDGRYEIRGRETTVRIPYSTPPQQYTKEWAVDVTYIISENGDRITERSLFNTGKVGNELIYVWRQGLSQ